MSTKKLSLGAAAALLLMAATPPDVNAQSLRPYPSGSQPASQVVTAVNTDSAILIQYIGAQQSGTVQVSSGDILLKHGVLSSEIADTTITGCGGTTGTLDVDNAACLLIGQTVDRCNASANWRCVQLDSLRSTSDSAGKLVDVAAQPAKVTGGYGIKWATATLFQSVRALVPVAARSIEFYLDGTGFRANPFQGTQTFLSYFNETATFTGAGNIEFWSDTPVFSTGTGSATEKQEFITPNGATTVQKVIADFEFQPLPFQPGARAVVRVNNGTNLTAIVMVGTAYQTPSP